MFLLCCAFAFLVVPRLCFSALCVSPALLFWPSFAALAWLRCSVVALLSWPGFPVLAWLRCSGLALLFCFGFAVLAWLCCYGLVLRTFWRLLRATENDAAIATPSPPITPWLCASSPLWSSGLALPPWLGFAVLAWLCCSGSAFSWFFVSALLRLRFLVTARLCFSTLCVLPVLFPGFSCLLCCARAFW